MSIINLTNHALTYKAEDGAETVFAPSGSIAKVITKYHRANNDTGFLCFSTSVEDIENLPAVEDGKFYIVSAAVAKAAPERKDLLIPNLGGSAVRDESGALIAIKSFRVN